MEGREEVKKEISVPEILLPPGEGEECLDEEGEDWELEGGVRKAGVCTVIQTHFLILTYLYLRYYFLVGTYFVNLHEIPRL